MTRSTHLKLLFLCLMLVSDAWAQQGRFYKPNQHQYYYVLTPSGFNAPPGQSMIQNGMIGINQYQKTNFNGNSWGLGLIPTLLLGESYMPVWVFAHKRIPVIKKQNGFKSVLNIGGFFLSIPQTSGDVDSDNIDHSIFYANASFGRPDKNFAIGGFVAPTGFDDRAIPRGVSLHGMVRLGKRSCLVTENYIIQDGKGVWIPFSMGGWRFWKRRLALDTMIFLTPIPERSSHLNRSFFLPIPWISVHYNRQRMRS